MKSYHDIDGDGGSGVVAQVLARKSRILENMAGVRYLLAIGSGKGGVGKSTLTTQIARVLKARGRKVAILDADLNGPTQARLTGLAIAPLVPGNNGVVLPRSPLGIGVISMGGLVPEPEAVDFASVSQGDSYTWRATSEFTLLAELLASVEWGELDYLLVDLPPGPERTQHYGEFFGELADFVLVTLPSDLARGVVGRSLASLRSKQSRIIGYIENMSGYYCEDCGEVKPLFPQGSESNLDIPCLGRVPFDPRLAARCDRGNAVQEAPRPAWESINKAVDEIAARLERTP